MLNLKVYNSTTQHISRKAFWTTATGLYLAYGIIFFVIKIIADAQSNPDWWTAIEIMRVLFCLAFIPILVKRLHDLNKSGWFCLFAMLATTCFATAVEDFTLFVKAPMIGLLVLGVIAGLFPGTSGENKYGDNQIQS